MRHQRLKEVTLRDEANAKVPSGRKSLPHAPLHVVYELRFQRVDRAKVLFELRQTLLLAIDDQRLLPRQVFQVSDVLFGMFVDEKVGQGPRLGIGVDDLLWIN